MDFASMADLIPDDRTPKRWTICKELLVRKRCAGVVTDPTRDHFAGAMISTGISI
jgi:hypothetical protein